MLLRLNNYLPCRLAEKVGVTENVTQSVLGNDYHPNQTNKTHRTSLMYRKYPEHACNVAVPCTIIFVRGQTFYTSRAKRYKTFC